MRAFIAVIVGYLSMVVGVFALFTGLYLVLGADGAFEPGSWEVSTTWLFGALFLSFIAAIVGGFVCRRIGRSKKMVLVLAGIVLVLGLIQAVATLNQEPPSEPRDASVDNMTAMTRAQTPSGAAIATAFIGAAGVLIGGRIGRSEDDEDEDAA